MSLSWLIVGCSALVALEPIPLWVIFLYANGTAKQHSALSYVDDNKQRNKKQTLFLSLFFFFGKFTFAFSRAKCENCCLRGHTVEYRVAEKTASSLPSAPAPMPCATCAPECGGVQCWEGEVSVKLASH